MGRFRRFLVRRAVYDSYEDDFPAAQEAALTACPEAARFTDEDAEAFWAVALYLDTADHTAITKSLKRAKIPYPPELAFDEYRLSCYLFRRWSDPGVRHAFLDLGLTLDYSRLARFRRTRDLAGFRPNMEAWGTPASLYVLRRSGMVDMIPPLLDTFSPQEAARHKALIQFGKLALHRFLTELEPARVPTPWEQQKLVRRIRLREVQLRSLRGSLRKLRQERTSLQSRLQEIGRIDQPQLNALASEWGQLRSQLAEAEQRHVVALEEQESRYRKEVARLQAELAATEKDYSDTLAVRRAWMKKPGG